MNCLYLLWMAGISFAHQGGWETDETVEEAACREALEEAGVRGLLQVSLLCPIPVNGSLMFMIFNALII